MDVQAASADTQADMQANPQADQRSDALEGQILDLFAREARVDRALLQPEARADTLGITSLDLTLALFELEDRFDVQLPDLLSPGSAAPTVGELVQHVLQAIRDRPADAAGSTTATAATPDAPALQPARP